MIAAAVPVGHLLTPDQVAKRLWVPRSMVYAEIKKARMKALYVGRFARLVGHNLARLDQTTVRLPHPYLRRGQAASPPKGSSATSRSR